jgi:hypothetical protein
MAKIYATVVTELQAALTPVIAIATVVLGIATYRIQRRQTEIQQQVAAIQPIFHFSRRGDFGRREVAKCYYGQFLPMARTSLARSP